MLDSMKIAHLCPDEKFIDIAIDIFSHMENIKSDFYIATDNPVNFIKSKNIQIVSKTKETIKKLNEQSYDYIIIHSLYFFPQNLLLKLKAKLIAITWGYDIESDCKDLIKMPINLELFKYYTRNAISVKPFNEKFHNFLMFLHCKIHNWQNAYYKLFKRLSYISTVLPNEYDLIHKTYPDIKYFYFDYMDANANIPFVASTKINNNILVGHCTLPTNNHIDILNTLEKRKVKCNAYIPLAYPNGSFEQFNSVFYKNEVKNFCKNLQYVNPIFLDTYIDKYEYFKIIDNCSCAVFGQLRQEATGNINHMLYTGKKIFMYKDGLNYQYYSRHAKVFTIDDDLNNTIFDSVLETDIQYQNWKFIHDKENYSLFLNKLYDHIKNL